MSASREFVRTQGERPTAGAWSAGGASLQRHAPTEEGVPWSCPRLARTLRSVPAAQALEAFDVPYVAFAPDTGAAQASPAAAMILDDGGPHELWRHLVRLVAGAVPAGTGTTPRRMLVPCGTYVCSARTVRGPAGPIAIVVLQPTPKHQPAAAPEMLGLTSRQVEIARLIAAGESTKRIATALAISQHTVRHHTEHLFEKLGVGSRAAAAAVVSSWELSRT